MKKTILPFFALLCLCASAIAQFSAGQVLLGGSLAFNTTNASPNNTTTNYVSGNGVIINPTIGFFKNDKTLYSFGIMYGHNSSHYLTSSYGTQKNVGNNYGLTFSKQWFKPITKDLYFTFAGTLSGSYQETKTTYDQSNMYETDKGSFFSLGVSPGLTYKLNKWLLCDLTIPSLAAINFNSGTHHSGATSGVDSKATYNTFGFNTNLNNSFLNNVAIGFRVLLANKSR